MYCILHNSPGLRREDIISYCNINAWNDVHDPAFSWWLRYSSMHLSIYDQCPRFGRWQWTESNPSCTHPPTPPPTASTPHMTRIHIGTIDVQVKYSYISLLLYIGQSSHHTYLHHQRHIIDLTKKSFSKVLSWWASYIWPSNGRAIPVLRRKSRRALRFRFRNSSSKLDICWAPITYSRHLFARGVDQIRLGLASYTFWIRRRQGGIQVGGLGVLVQIRCGLSRGTAYEGLIWYNII